MLETPCSVGIAWFHRYTRLKPDSGFVRLKRLRDTPPPGRVLSTHFRHTCAPNLGTKKILQFRNTYHPVALGLPQEVGREEGAGLFHARVLLAEADTGAAKRAREILEQAGYMVTVEGDGKQVHGLS